MMLVGRQGHRRKVGRAQLTTASSASRAPRAAAWTTQPPEPYPKDPLSSVCSKQAPNSLVEVYAAPRRQAAGPASLLCNNNLDSTMAPAQHAGRVSSLLEAHSNKGRCSASRTPPASAGSCSFTTRPD